MKPAIPFVVAEAEPERTAPARATCEGFEAIYLFVKAAKPTSSVAIVTTRRRREVKACGFR